MRILLITENFAPAWAFGGPPKVLFDISRELVKRGHCVTVITTNILDELNIINKTEDVFEGIKVYYLKTFSKWLAWNLKIFLPVRLNNLLKKCTNKFDIILMANFRNVTNIIGYYYAKKGGIPYVLLPYGSLPRGNHIKRIVKWIVDIFIGYNVLKNASAVFSQTENEVKESIKFGAKYNNVKLIPLNLDFNEFQNLPLKGIFRKKHGIQNHEKIILFLGRINIEKGLNLLIQSFSRFKNIINYNCKLIIIGRDDGYLFDMLKLINNLKLKEEVLYPGAIYGEKRIEAYVDADVFVMPSRFFEETSTAALEACAASTPVIVTKQASIPYLDKYQAGITINYNQKALVNALQKILGDDILRLEMGVNARKMIEEIFDLRQIVDLYEEVFENLAGKIYTGC